MLAHLVPISYNVDHNLQTLNQKFFERSALVVAKDLIGNYLVRKMQDGKILRIKITETEAYIGPQDLACHAAKGRTPRTEILYGAPGHFYIYFVYGMHYMLNVVTCKEGYPAGVLIRGVEGTNGPAKVCKLMEIDTKLLGKPANKKTGLWFEAGKKEKIKIEKLPRIGVAYSGEWAKKPYRFLLCN